MIENNNHFKKSLLTAMALLTLVFYTQTVFAIENSQVAFNKKDFDCLIEPNKYIQVASPVEGIVETLHVIRGDRVKKGKPLFSLRNEQEKAAVDLARARAEYRARQVQRNEKIEDRSLISDQQRDETETDKRLADAELASAEVMLALKSVASPIDGIVVERFKHEGEYVEKDPVVAMVSIDPLYVEVVAPIFYLGKIKKGGKANVFPEYSAEPNRQYAAKVMLVDSVVDAASGTFRVRLVLANSGGVLPSGLKCEIEFS